MMPPATPPAIAPTLGPLSLLSDLTGAVEDVGYDEGVCMIVRVIITPLSVTTCFEVCGSSGVRLACGVEEGLLLYYKN
jgi:hypothetical protein